MVDQRRERREKACAKKAGRKKERKKGKRGRKEGKIQSIYQRLMKSPEWTVYLHKGRAETELRLRLIYIHSLHTEKSASIRQLWRLTHTSASPLWPPLGKRVAWHTLDR